MSRPAALAPFKEGKDIAKACDASTPAFEPCCCFFSLPLAVVAPLTLPIEGGVIKAKFGGCIGIPIF